MSETYNEYTIPLASFVAVSGVKLAAGSVTEFAVDGTTIRIVVRGSPSLNPVDGVTTTPFTVARFDWTALVPKFPSLSRLQKLERVALSYNLGTGILTFTEEPK